MTGDGMMVMIMVRPVMDVGLTGTCLTLSDGPIVFR